MASLNPDSMSCHRLVLERVSKNDNGSYCCRASNDLNVVFSNWVEVVVQQPVQGELFTMPASSFKLSLSLSFLSHSDRSP